MPDRPAIPPEIRRQVRQRCCFGCVVCGSPIYHYDHLVEWNICRVHDSDNINLLCPDHHARKGRLLPLDVLERFIAHPFNCRSGESRPEHLFFDAPEYAIECGSNSLCVTDGQGSSAILINGHSVLGFKREGSALLLDLDLRAADGTVLATIEDNALTYTVDQSWDITFDYGHILTIRSAPRCVELRVDFQPPDRVVVSSGQFWYEGVGVDVRPSRVMIHGIGSPISGNTSENTDAVLAIGRIPADISASYEFHLTRWQFPGKE